MRFVVVVDRSEANFLDRVSFDSNNALGNGGEVKLEGGVIQNGLHNTNHEDVLAAENAF